MRYLFFALLLAACSTPQPPASIASSATDQAHAACTATAGEMPQLVGITVSDDAADFEDMRTLRVTDEASGGFLLVHYDSGSEAMARAKAACLGAQIATIGREVGDERKAAQWDSVVFTQTAFNNLTSPGEVTRWPVFVQDDSQLDFRSVNAIGWVIPHEQVHAYQAQNGFNFPRWLAEGHAVWIDFKLADRFDPIVTARQIAARAQKAAESEGPLKLLEWGKHQPRREAYYRQVGDEERAKMDADLSYYPSGVFTFTDDDFEVEYVANDQARYLAAFRVLKGLEDRHGAAAVHAWIADLVTSHNAPISDGVVDTSLQTHFGETLDEVLDNLG